MNPEYIAKQFEKLVIENAHTAIDVIMTELPDDPDFEFCEKSLLLFIEHARRIHKKRKKKDA